MCMSQLHRVLRTPIDQQVEVADVVGTVHRVSLLALDGPAPKPGDWLLVHSGYAFDRVDRAEAESLAGELRNAMRLAARETGDQP
jgi:hydrogenase maturation factor